MKILFLADNFPPETNAPAIRTYEHAREWVRAGNEVTIVTCAPNFPRGEIFPGYRNRIWQREEIDGIHVVRVWTYIAANEGSVKRIVDYISFMVASVLGSFALQRPDVVVATSPQFFAAVAGYLVSILKWRPFVFELRDLWPETIVAVGAIKKRPLIYGLERLASYLYRHADLVVSVTQAFARHVQTHGVDPRRIMVITNGIEPEWHRPQEEPRRTRERYGLREETFLAGYIGTLGLCHGLEALVNAADLTREDKRIHYVLMGDGADREKLSDLVSERRLDNVTILDGQPHQEAMELLNAVDVSLVLLKDSPLFETVIPSKIFEAMALGKPIVLGVRGESLDIVVNQTGTGLAFPPEDPQALVDVVRKLEADPALRAKLGKAGHAAVQKRFRRSALAADMLSAIERCAKRIDTSA